MQPSRACRDSTNFKLRYYADTPSDAAALVGYLVERLRRAFPNFSPDQVVPNTHSVTVKFRKSGLDVDVVPILYDGDEQWRGKLVSQDDGSLLETSIPLHLEFFGERKKAYGPDFVQMVRLAKFWARKTKGENPKFRFKSFMIELILSHLCDTGTDLSDYPEALQSFFTYIARTGMRGKIVFDDHHPKSAVGQFQDPVQIVDPVNPENNVARLYGETEVDAMVDAALKAGDAIDAALYAPTERETVHCWSVVFGDQFRAAWREMDRSRPVAGTATPIRTHAVHIAAKIAADLKRMQRFYGEPSDEKIGYFETEAIRLLEGGYLDTVIYGFRLNGCWIEPTLRYAARDMPDGNAGDDDPGKVRPGSQTGDASFYSSLTYGDAWDRLPDESREEIYGQLPLRRSPGPRLDIVGGWSGDRTYSAGNRALYRDSLGTGTR